LAPRPGRDAELHALAGAALLAHALADPLELLGPVLVDGNDLVEQHRDAAHRPLALARQADREVAGPHGFHGMEQFVEVGGFGTVSTGSRKRGRTLAGWGDGLN